MKTLAALINKSCGGHKVETSTQSLPAAVFASLVPLPRALRCSDFDGAVMTDRRLSKVVSRCHRSLFVGAALKDVTYEFFIGCFFLISPSSGRRHKNETPTNTRGAVCVLFFKVETCGVISEEGRRTEPTRCAGNTEEEAPAVCLSFSLNPVR